MVEVIHTPSEPEGVLLLTVGGEVVLKGLLPESVRVNGDGWGWASWGSGPDQRVWLQLVELGVCVSRSAVGERQSAVPTVVDGNGNAMEHDGKAVPLLGGVNDA